MSTAEQLSEGDRERAPFVPRQLHLVEDPPITSEMSEVVALMAWVLAHAPERIRNHPDTDVVLMDFQTELAKKTPGIPSSK